ncbi:MAG: hypothetical protein HQ557_13025 [Bacteroidetes bacterium]|nr:hypothetical protein [Bacteroidota bacterium]
MSESKIFTIHATGCCLVDTIYQGISFSTREFKDLMRTPEDPRGLMPGQLVFREDLEEMSGLSLDEIIDRLNTHAVLPVKNIGGPAIVALIAVSQMLGKGAAEISFSQFYGKDENGKFILKMLKNNAPDISISHYTEIQESTAETLVLSDPDFDEGGGGGGGERTFINTIGSAGLFTPRDLPENFFSADMIVYGGTGLTPVIHENLTELLQKAYEKEAVTVVTTVYDFLNEKKSSGTHWPLGSSVKSYRLIDLLITDMEEALRLSGQDSVEKSIIQFREWGLTAAVITSGAKPVWGYADPGNRIFKVEKSLSMPVSSLVDQEIAEGLVDGDTTGCGDNFAGGIITSIASQLTSGAAKGNLKLSDAVQLGICTGGAARYHIGGVMQEEKTGMKLTLVQRLLEAYIQQENGNEEAETEGRKTDQVD